MKTQRGTPLPLGATVQQETLNFALVAPQATMVTLALFSVEKEQPIATFPLDPSTHRTGDVWHIGISGLSLPLLYGWQIESSPKFLLDPYARLTALTGSWGEKKPLEKGLLGLILAEEPFDWEGDQPLQIPLKDLILYEMHVRAFTQDPSSQVAYPGTYCAITEKIPYLCELGINAIELMPIYEFDETDNPFKNPLTQAPLFNVWGYAPLSFFAPMRRYATGVTSPLQEIKQMVKELHKNGIELILDVVYNHTATSPFILPAIAPTTYYLDPPLDFTGCGNTLKCNHPVTMALIIDSLRYWVLEMHIDGFRFDLAAVFYRGEEGRLLTLSPLIEAISKDPILSRTKLIAEPWDAVGTYQVGRFYPSSMRWSEWNDRYRDTLRGFINGLTSSKGELATRLSGSQDLYGTRGPTSSINFITAHDGFTLKDLVSYSHKHNTLNGEENRDGHSHNLSASYGVEGLTEDPAIQTLRYRQMRNFFTLLFLSQGVPMIYMGDEYGHTKQGNNNSYAQDDPTNWFQWNQLTEQKSLFRFVKGLIAFRKQHPLLRRDQFLTEKEISWHGLQLFHPDWEKGDPLLAFTLHDPENQEDLYIAINMSLQPATFQLPTPHTQWYRRIDTSLTAPDDIIESDALAPLIQEPIYSLESRSILLLKQRVRFSQISLPN